MSKSMDKRVSKLNEYTTSQGQLESLKEFARHIIKEELWGYRGMDGMEIQDLAVKLGLIEPHTLTKEDVPMDYDLEVGDEIYMFTDILKEANK